MSTGQYNATGFTLSHGSVASLQLDASGALKTTLTADGAALGSASNPISVHATSAEQGWAYYYAFSSDYAAYATPTDLIELICPAGKKIEVLHALAGLNATAAALATVMYLSRSAANTGGTSSSLTPQKYDTNAADSTATVKLYSAAPSLGASLREWSRGRASIAASTAAPTAFTLWTPGGAQGYSNLAAAGITAPSITLNAGETFAINFGSAAIPAGFVAVTISLMWREMAV